MCDIFFIPATSEFGLKTQMAQSKEGIVGIFTIESILHPIPVERPFVSPKAIYKVQAGFLNIIQRNLHAGQRMEGSSR